MLVLGGEHSFNKAGTQLRRHYSLCIWVQCMLSHVQLSANPMDCSPPGSFVHGISQARMLEWRRNLCLWHLLHWQANSLPLAPPGKLCIWRRHKSWSCFPSCQFHSKSKQGEFFFFPKGKGKLTETLTRTPCAHVDLRELCNFISFFFF